MHSAFITFGFVQQDGGRPFRPAERSDFTGQVYNAVKAQGFTPFILADGVGSWDDRDEPCSVIGFSFDDADGAQGLAILRLLDDLDVLAYEWYQEAIGFTSGPVTFCRADRRKKIHRQHS